jgi:NADH:ubiquinone oxidoreductase subunit 3 (subunit A)
MIYESLIALTLISIATVAIYTIGKRSAPKNVPNESQQASYACGENVPTQNSNIHVSLFKYLIYFVIFDTSVLMLAFGSLTFAVINPYIMIAFLVILLASALVVVEGGSGGNN